MNNSAFFDAIRPSFGGKLTGRQVQGMEALLKAGEGMLLHHLAFTLANVRRETGGGMFPIKETVMPYHKDQNPSDEEVIKRLDKAYAEGRLSHVKTPYWRYGWFGRGQLQVSHKENYEKFGISDPKLALDLDVSAHIAVEGMRDGRFTGRKLADYDFPACLDLPAKQHPRRIVNGIDGSDIEVSGFHRDFHAALVASQDSLDSYPVAPPASFPPRPLPPVQAPAPDPAPTPAPQVPDGIWAALWRVLRWLAGHR